MQKYQLSIHIFPQNQRRMGCGPASSSNTSEPKPQPHGKKRPIQQIKQHRNNNPDEITEAITITDKKLKEPQVKFAVNALQHHQLFGTMNKKELQVIVQEMIVAKPKHQSGYIFRQGDTGTCFFLIYSGTVDTEIDGKVIRSLGKGDTFGQLALLFRSPRTASILAASNDCEFLVVKPVVFKKTVKKMRMDQQFKNSQTIQKVPLFSCLTNKQKYALSNTVKILIFNAGEAIFKQGDDAQALYIISDGHVSIEIEGKKDIQLHTGQIFGEASIQDNMTRSGTATAVTKTMCSMISRNDIETTLGSSICNLIFYNTKKWALMRSPIFKQFTPAEINRVIISFESFSLEDGKPIKAQKYKGFIICLEGQINKKPEGTLFNEHHWTSKSFKCDDKLIKNGKGHCGYLSFNKASQIFEDIAARKKLTHTKDSKSSPKSSFSLQNFTYLKKLGEGQFGQVYLVKNNQFGNNLYAVKTLSKEYIRKEQMEEAVVAEKRILEKIIFPYIVGYVKAFHDKKYIYLVMEYIHGKQMFDVIRQVKSMNSQMVKYYFACLLISIEYLHVNNFVYRDLKPENSVVDSKGKVYLIDLGTAKELVTDTFFKTFTIIGTPHYMAPQVFEGNGYSFEVDFWSLGCLLYQFLCFKLPFGEGSQSDPYSIFTSIKKTNLTFPKFFKDEKAKKLMGHLLQKDPQKRGAYSFDKIKKSEYFRHFSWPQLLEEQMKGPYIPKQFKSNTLQDLQQIEGKSFLKHLYKDSRKATIEEWDGTI